MAQAFYPANKWKQKIIPASDALFSFLSKWKNWIAKGRAVCSCLACFRCPSSITVLWTLLDKVFSDSTAGVPGYRTPGYLVFMNVSKTRSNAFRSPFSKYLTYENWKCKGILQLNKFKIGIGMKEALKIRPWSHQGVWYLLCPASLKAILWWCTHLTVLMFHSWTMA